MKIKIIEARKVQTGTSSYTGKTWRVQEVKCMEIADDEAKRPQWFIATVKNDKIEQYNLHTGDIVEADDYKQIQEYTNKDGSVFEKNTISLINLNKIGRAAVQNAQQHVTQQPNTAEPKSAERDPFSEEPF